MIPASLSCLTSGVSNVTDFLAQVLTTPRALWDLLRPGACFVVLFMIRRFPHPAAHLYPHPSMIKICGAVGEVLVWFRRLVHADRLIVLLRLCQLWLIQYAAPVFIDAQERYSEGSEILPIMVMDICNTVQNKPSALTKVDPDS